MKHAGIVVVLSFVCAGMLLAQKPEMPKPGPEHQKLGAFVGNWTFEGEMKPGPMGPGGKITGTDRIQWLPGNFFVERRYEGTGAMGTMSGLQVFGYDSSKKIHSYTDFDCMGMSSSGTMTLSGNTWTTNGTINAGARSFAIAAT